MRGNSELTLSSHCTQAPFVIANMCSESQFPNIYKQLQIPHEFVLSPQYQHQFAQKAEEEAWKESSSQVIRHILFVTNFQLEYQQKCLDSLRLITRGHLSQLSIPKQQELQASSNIYERRQARTLQMLRQQNVQGQQQQQQPQLQQQQQPQIGLQQMPNQKQLQMPPTQQRLGMRNPMGPDTSGTLAMHTQNYIQFQQAASQQQQQAQQQHQQQAYPANMVAAQQHQGGLSNLNQPINPPAPTRPQQTPKHWQRPAQFPQMQDNTLYQPPQPQQQVTAQEIEKIAQDVATYQFWKSPRKDVAPELLMKYQYDKALLRFQHLRESNPYLTDQVRSAMARHTKSLEARVNEPSISHGNLR
jgi:hypothetical protein